MTINFDKYTDGLVPVIIQDAETCKVLMLGFMNQEAYEATIAQKKVTFYSRSKERLWTKGETSGNYLHVVEILSDCDNDTLLVKVKPVGPVCHTGGDTCFNEKNENRFIYQLEKIIEQRRVSSDQKSYTRSLFESGLNRIAQKVGEEAVETVIASKDDDRSAFINEAADLLFHYLVLLQAKGTSLKTIEDVLSARHTEKTK
jgi:phosphoribosyl-ATP pyrophosphohydrolase/phosphoribosyl-AMP cyclohydrolase